MIIVIIIHFFLLFSVLRVLTWTFSFANKKLVSQEFWHLFYTVLCEYFNIQFNLAGSVEKFLLSCVKQKRRQMNPKPILIRV
jgi:hypothetical protein